MLRQGIVELQKLVHRQDPGLPVFCNNADYLPIFKFHYLPFACLNTIIANLRGIEIILYLGYHPIGRHIIWSIVWYTITLVHRPDTMAWYCMIV